MKTVKSDKAAGKYLFGLLLLMLIGSSLVSGQEKSAIKGTVKGDVTGEILIGANVFIKDLSLGASTDTDGKFTIGKVPAGTYELVARYVGFEPQTVEVNVAAGKTVEVNFSLSPTAVELNELVVTGQGAAIERKKLSSTVATINADEIRNAPVESVDQLLQGRVAGLNSFTSSGMPGTSGRISTRGVKSAVTSTTPVVYVDGVRVDNNDAFRLALDSGGAESSALADLVVGEIDHIEVIKGGAASTLYGSEAANGVIQIFTKKGTPGKPRWTFNVTSGMDEPEEYFISEDYVKNNVLQTGLYQSYRAAVSGGSSEFTYNINGQMYDNRGIFKEDKANSQNYNLNTGFRVALQDNMNLELSASYTKNKFGRVFNNNTINAPFAEMEIGTYGDHNGYTDADRDSLLQLMLAPKLTTDIDRFRVAANFDYTPFERFFNKVTLGVDYRNGEERTFVPKAVGYFFVTDKGWLERSDREYQTITMQYTGTYTFPQIGAFEQKVTFGAQGFRVDDREEYAIGQEFAIPGTDDFDNAAIIDAAESNRELFNGGFFLTDQIGLWDKLFFDAGFRVDGNSTFGDDIGMQFYPKLGVAYNITQEKFFPSVVKKVVSNLKLRAAWGVTGNFPEPFTKDRIYGAQSYLGTTGIVFEPEGNPGNDDLKPEKTYSYDVGFDMGLFRDKASFEFNYFHQTTKDALFRVPRDPASGFNTQLTNVGEILNKGIELVLNAQIYQSKGFSVNAKASYSTLHNEVISLGGAAPFNLASFTFLPRRVEEGHPVGTFRVNKPVADADGNFTGDYEEVLMGNPLPSDFGSVGLNFTIMQNLTVSALAEFAFGHQFVDLKKILRFFNGTEDTENVVPDGYSFNTASSVWVQDADWIKLREIAVVYRVPDYLFSGLSLNASVRNVAVLGTDSDADPELNGYQPGGPNTGGYFLPDVSAPRQYRFGVTVTL